MNNVNENGKNMSSLHLRGASGAQKSISLRSAILAARDALILPVAKRHDDKCSGRSMIEMLGVLAIIGVLSVGGIAGYSKAMHRYRVNKTIDQITYMAGAIRTFFAPQKSYNGLTAHCIPNQPCLAKKAKLVPDDMWVDGKGWPQNVWGKDAPCGDTVARFGDETYKAFYIAYYNIPEEACIDLLTQDWNNVGVEFTEMWGGDYDVACATLPAPIDTAIEACGRAQYLGSVTMYFFFDVDVNDYKNNYGDVETWY